MEPIPRGELIKTSREQQGERGKGRESGGEKETQRDVHRNSLKFSKPEPSFSPREEKRRISGQIAISPKSGKCPLPPLLLTNQDFQRGRVKNANAQI